MFIKLTMAAKPDLQMLVNLDNVETFIPADDTTQVYFCGGDNDWIMVTETLKEIEKKILVVEDKKEIE